MNDTFGFASRLGALALVSALAGCATWGNMDRQEKGATVGAGGGALVGAAVAGPVGALVGAGAGAYAGHYETKPGGIASNTPPGRSTGNTAMTRDADHVRSVQRALNDRGFNAGPADGVWGTGTEQALRQFQQANGLPVTGALDQRTAAALGVSR